MLFLAVVKDFDFFAKMKIQFKRGMVHCSVADLQRNSRPTFCKCLWFLKFEGEGSSTRIRCEHLKIDIQQSRFQEIREAFS